MHRSDPSKRPHRRPASRDRNATANRKSPFSPQCLVEAVEGRTLMASVSEAFTSGAGGFTAVDGAWAASGGQYQVTAAGTAASTHLNTRSVHSTAVNGDFTLTADASAAATGNAWNDFAVVFGYQDPTNYYFVSFNESNDGQTSGIFKVANGTSTQLADVNQPITAGTTYGVRVERAGSAIRAYLGGTLAASATDGTYTSGRVGFGTKGDRGTFDSLVVTEAVPAPAAPSGLTATTASSSQIDLRWTDNAGDETGYHVERSADGGASWGQVAALPAGTTTYAATGLTAATAYGFRVRAYNAGGPSAYSGTASATTSAAAPPPAQVREDFTSGAGNVAAVDGAWGASGGTYQVVTPGTAATTHLNTRAVHATNVAGNFTMTADAAAVATSSGWNDFALLFGYQDGANYYFVSLNESNDGQTSGIFKVVNGVSTQLADVAQPHSAGTTYAVRVDRDGSVIRAYVDGALLATATDGTFTDGQVGFGTKGDRATFDNLSVGALANPPAAPTPPAAPSGLSATAASASQINLAWSDNSTNETGFHVERSTNGTTWTRVATVGANTKSYAGTGLAAGTRYSFRVLAYNGAGASPASAVASATTAAAATPAPQPGARPGAGNTGPTDPAALRAVGGFNLTAAWAAANASSGAGTAADPYVIEDLDVAGSLQIQASNVTLRNFRVSANVTYVVRATYGATNIVLEDGEVRGGVNTSACVFGAQITLRRLDIHESGGDGLKPEGSNFVLEHSWIHHLGLGAGAHADGVQARSTIGSGYWTGHVYRGNYFDMDVRELTGSYKSNACLYLTDYDGVTNGAGGIRGAVIDGNWFAGGNYTVHLSDGDITGTIMTNNRWERDSYRYGPMLGRDSHSVATWSGNVYDDDGQLIP